MYFENFTHVFNFKLLSKNFNEPMLIFSEISPMLTLNIYGEDQNFLDSEFSWDIATKIVAFSENDFRDVRKKLER